MRILCLDWGDKRIGVAVSDPTGMLASSVGTIPNDNFSNVAGKVALLCEDLQVDSILFGLPLDSNGNEGMASKRVKKAAQRLAENLDSIGRNVPIEFWDESHTTKESNMRMIEGGLGRRKRRGIIDKIAAQSILQDYLNNSNFSGGVSFQNPLSRATKSPRSG